MRRHPASSSTGRARARSAAERLRRAAARILDAVLLGTRLALLVLGIAALATSGVG